MKLIKIDAKNQLLTEIQFNEGGSLKALQEACGGWITTAVELNSQCEIDDTYEGNRNTIYVDDEGLFKGYNYGFQIEGAHQPFLGNGALSGVDAEGDTTDPTITIEQLEKIITWFVLE